MGRSRLFIAVFAAGLGTGCLVQIDHVADPRPAFDRARADALRAAAEGPGRPRRLNVLVYDAGERKLVRVSLPWWLARKAQGLIGREARSGNGRRAERDSLARSERGGSSRGGRAAAFTSSGQPRAGEFTSPERAGRSSRGGRGAASPPVKDELRGRAVDRLRHLGWKELDAAGRGILVEAEEDGGEQVLIWLR